MFKKLLFGTIVFFVLSMGYCYEYANKSYTYYIDGIVKTFNLSSDKNLKMLVYKTIRKLQILLVALRH